MARAAGGCEREDKNYRTELVADSQGCHIQSKPRLSFGDELEYNYTSMKRRLDIREELSHLNWLNRTLYTGLVWGAPTMTALYVFLRYVVQLERVANIAALMFFLSLFAVWTRQTFYRCPRCERMFHQIYIFDSIPFYSRLFNRKCLSCELEREC